MRKDSLCVLPWIGREIRADGTMSVCCISDMSFKNSHDEKILIAESPSEAALEADDGLKKLKLALQKGSRPKACQACWKLEQAGGVSRRQKMNREHHEKLARIKKNTSANMKKIVFDFKVGNVCNQKCLICGPAASSLWIQEHRAVYASSDYIKTKNISKRTLPALSGSAFDAREIHISGGEPFLHLPDLEKLLTPLINSGVARKQKLIITTNGSVYPEKLIKEVFPQFKKVQILLSADGVGPHFEYLRFPAKWPVFFDHYLRYKKSGFFAGICLTINALNAYNLGDYLQFWDEQGEKQVLVNYLNSPEVLAVDALPRPVRELIGRKWLEARFPNSEFEVLMLELFQYLRLFDKGSRELKVNSVIESISKHDKYRGVQFGNVFKDFDQVLSQAVGQR